MALLLLLQPLLQLFHYLVPAAERLDLGLFLIRQEPLGQGFEPFFRNFRLKRFRHQVEALENMAEDLVELVEIAFILHQRRARQIIEILDPFFGKIRVQRPHQGEILLERHPESGRPSIHGKS